jgi:glycosyltransferase involved in cell wall biosynthesis
MRIRGSLDLYSSLRLSRFLRKKNVDVLMPFLGKDYWMAVLAGRLAGVPVLINRSTPHSINPVSIPVMKAAAGIVAVSKGIREILTGQGLPAEKVHVVYLGVNAEVFSPNAVPPKEEIRERHALPQDAFLVGCFGRSSKGQREVLKADALMPKHHDRLHYFFAGEHIPERLGPVVREQPSLAGRVTLRDQISHEEVPALLKALDLVVMLPEREPFSNAVLEAMAMEKPVILSRTLGNIEAVEDGVSGILVDRDDLRALAGHIRGLIEDPPRREQMGREAGERVRELFTEEVMMDRMEELWRRVAAPSR